jgi:hypothetical protein
LRQNEAGAITLPRARADWHQATGQSFTLHGHRLSSLYRIAIETLSRLRKDEGFTLHFANNTQKTTSGGDA